MVSSVSTVFQFPAGIFQYVIRLLGSSKLLSSVTYETGAVLLNF